LCHKTRIFWAEWWLALMQKLEKATQEMTAFCLYRHKLLTLYRSHHAAPHFFEHGNFQLIFLK